MTSDILTRKLADFLRAAPHKPLAAPRECLEAECRICHANPWQACDTGPPRLSLAGMVFGAEWRFIHLRRYVDYTGDRR